MARLAMTKAMVDAIAFCYASNIKSWPPNAVEDEPTLELAEVGKPITYGQVIELSDVLRHYFEESGNEQLQAADGTFKYDLDSLLKGSRVNAEPTKAKDRNTTEYDELMARLRKEEEDRYYEKLIKPAPSKGAGRWFSAATSSSSKKDDEDELTFSDLNRQIALVFNVLLSIVACAYALWAVARNWSTPLRLALSMGGAFVVGVAEIVVYFGYLRRIGEARDKSKRHVETKEIMETWVISSRQNPESKETSPAPVSEAKKDKAPLRKRKHAK